MRTHKVDSARSLAAPSFTNSAETIQRKVTKDTRSQSSITQEKQKTSCSSWLISGLKKFGKALLYFLTFQWLFSKKNQEAAKGKEVPKPEVAPVQKKKVPDLSTQDSQPSSSKKEKEVNQLDESTAQKREDNSLNKLSSAPKSSVKAHSKQPAQSIVLPQPKPTKDRTPSPLKAQAKSPAQADIVDADKSSEQMEAPKKTPSRIFTFDLPGLRSSSSSSSTPCDLKESPKQRPPPLTLPQSRSQSRATSMSEEEFVKVAINEAIEVFRTATETMKGLPKEHQSFRQVDDSVREQLAKMETYDQTLRSHQHVPSQAFQEALAILREKVPLLQPLAEQQEKTFQPLADFSGPLELEIQRYQAMDEPRPARLVPIRQSLSAQLEKLDLLKQQYMQARFDRLQAGAAVEEACKAAMAEMSSSTPAV